MRELLERLREAEAAPSSHASETLAAFHAALGAHLSELRAEQASADRRTQSRLTELQGVLETLVARLASIESELAGDIDDELRPPAGATNPRPAAGSALPGVDGARARGRLNARPRPRPPGPPTTIRLNRRAARTS